jgi:hypothetical protein
MFYEGAPRFRCALCSVGDASHDEPCGITGKRRYAKSCGDDADPGQTDANAGADPGQTDANAGADPGQTDADAGADPGQTFASGRFCTRHTFDARHSSARQGYTCNACDADDGCYTGDSGDSGDASDPSDACG